MGGEVVGFVVRGWLESKAKCCDQIYLCYLHFESLGPGLVAESVVIAEITPFDEQPELHALFVPKFLLRGYVVPNNDEGWSI